MSEPTPQPPSGLPQKGTRGKIVVTFDTNTGETVVSADMSSQDMKNLSIGVLLQAISIIMHYKPSPIVRVPNGNMPPRLSN